MSWEAFWYSMDCPACKPLPSKRGVTPKDVARAYAKGTAGYRTTGGDVWYLGSDVTTPGWYHIGIEFQKEVFEVYNAAMLEALDRHRGTASYEDILAVLEDPNWSTTNGGTNDSVS